MSVASMSVNHNLEKEKPQTPPFGDGCAEAVIYDFLMPKEKIFQSVL